MWVWLLFGVICIVCTFTFVILLRQAPMDTDIWPGGEPQLNKPTSEPWETDEGIPW